MKDDSGKQAERSLLSLPIIFGAVLIVLAEAIAVGIVFRQHDLQLDRGWYIYLLPIFVLLPITEAARFLTLLKRELPSSDGGCQKVNLVGRLIVMIDVVYSAIILIMVFLLPHSRR